MSNFGINHFLDLGAPYRNFGTGNKAGVDYQPRYRALCGSWIQAGAGSHVITEITCDECLEALLKMVLNNLVLVETGNYEAIEAGWGFVRARRERDKALAGSPTNSKSKGVAMNLTYKRREPLIRDTEEGEGAKERTNPVRG